MAIIDDTMYATILENLDRIEQNHQVRILYAVESGSRAWGFASRNSDYDVRFIYIHKPEWYLSISEKRDVIECPITGDLDICGWDLRKALGLFSKSNPPMLEWLGSPLVYREYDSFVNRLRGMIHKFFSPRQCMHHYLHTARNNSKRYLSDDTVKLKKYFYALRPMLGCIWLERHNTMPPTEFIRLYEDAELNPVLVEAIDDLMKRKIAGDELDREQRIEVLDHFLDEQMRYYSNYVEQLPLTVVDKELLDELFRDTLLENFNYGYLIDNRR